MDIRSKLGLYKGEQPGEKVQLPSSGHDVQDIIPGTVCGNEDGSFFVMESRFPLSHLHGGCSLGAALNVSTQHLSGLCGDSCDDTTVDGLLFLDTETTGLSGGAGTVAFLAGTGFFEKDCFIVRQYFMRDYDEEPAMLRELNGLFSKYGGLVTFNGRSFDWNLLQGRFISNRIKTLLKNPVHVDLLFPARRIWGLKLESCRLSSLEENILGESREDDIPGAMIPQVYFKYLEDRDASEIKRVIRHNELDILSMVSLLVKMSAMLGSPLLEAGGEHELLGLGRIFEARGEYDRMIDCFECCAKSGNFPVKEAAVRRLSGVYKRNGNYGKAVEHWRSMAADSGGFNLFPMIELAKYYEHKEKDIPKAAEIVERAIELSLQAGVGDSTVFPELRRRQDRLKRKAEKYGGLKG